MDNIVKLYQNFISSNDTCSGSEDESELDDFTFDDDDDNDQDILNR